MTPNSSPLLLHWRIPSNLVFWFLAIFWTAELTCIQHLSTDEVAGIDTNVVLKDTGRRFILNFLCILAVLGLSPRKWMPLNFAFFFAFSNVVLAYFYYFGRPLSWLVISGQWNEGVAVSDHALNLVKIPVLLATLGLLAFKCFLTLRFPYGNGFIPFKRLGAITGGIFLATAVIFAGFYKPIHAVRFASPEYTYGYGLAWAVEAATWDSEAILAQANRQAKQTSEQLRGLQPPLELGDKIAIIQVESLDFDAIESMGDTESIMPFLRSLREDSMYFMVKPFHDVGSSEADFSFLTGCRPHGRINPYLVAGFSYSRSLPFLAKKHGYRSTAMHGNTGAFYQRRLAYDQMGFEEVLFAEELIARGIDGRWDHELLAYSSELLNQATEPTVHFLITLSSHGPFTKLPPDYDRLYDDSLSQDENYLNCMRYVDNSLEKYIASLPEGTTVMIYGDHESGVYGYQSDTDQNNMVPWIIYQKGRDISDLQCPESGVNSNSLFISHLDLARFIHAHFAKPEIDGSSRHKQTKSIHPWVESYPWSLLEVSRNG